MLPDTLDPRALESLLAFWNDAGAGGACFEDEPVDRLARPAPALAVARAAGDAAAAPLRVGPDREASVALARQLAAGAATITELKAAIDGFEGCTLRGGARQAVFARGPEAAPLMVIGDAPTSEDDAAGAPFTGAAGRLLDRMLAAIGMAEQAFITNAVFWRLGSAPHPSPDDCAACAPFLERAIQLVAPRALLLLGAGAARAVLGREEGILQLRGRWLDHVSGADAQATPALVTYAPAFLLTQPTAKGSAWRDLLSLAGRLDAVNRPPA